MKLGGDDLNQADCRGISLRTRLTTQTVAQCIAAAHRACIINDVTLLSGRRRQSTTLNLC